MGKCLLGFGRLFIQKTKDPGGERTKVACVLSKILLVGGAAPFATRKPNGWGLQFL